MSGFAELHDELRSVARGLLGEDAADDTTWWQIGDAGWLGLEVPESLDGAGATFAETAVVLEELGRAATPSVYVGTAVLGVAAALETEASPARDQLLRGIASGADRVAVAIAPNGDAATALPPFTFESGRLRGRADQVVDAPGAHHLLLLADTGERGPALVRVTPSQVDVTPEPVLDATRSLGSVTADGVAVAAEDVWSFVDEPVGAGQRLLDRGAVALAVDAMGVATAMLEATVDYVGVRHQFDRPVGSFQAVKHQCADMLVQLRLGRELLDDAVAAVATDAHELPIAAARAKSFLGATVVDVVGTAMQLHGGIGYTWESGIHRYLKRAVLDRALLGSPAAYRRRLAERFAGTP